MVLNSGLTAITTLNSNLNGLFKQESVSVTIKNAQVGVSSTDVALNIPSGYKFCSIRYFYCTYQGVIYCARPNTNRDKLVLEYRVFQAGDITLYATVEYIKDIQ